MGQSSPSSAEFDGRSLCRIPSGPRTAFVSNGESWTYERFAAMVDQLTAGLLRRGIARGERVALHLTNGPEFAACYFACFRIGAIAAPLNLRFKSAELDTALQRIKPSLYIGDADLYKRVAAIDPAPLPPEACFLLGTPLRAAAQEWRSLLTAPDTVGPISPPDGHAPAILLLTSGTTGTPKLVAHSLATMEAAIVNLITLGFDHGGSLALLRPMVHASGLFYLLSAIRREMTVVLLDTMDPDQILNALETRRCTVFPVPLVSCAALTQGQRFRQADLSSLRTTVISADVCPAGRQEAFEDTFGLPLKSFFASTEATFPFTCGLRSGDVGSPHAGTEVKLVGEDGNPVGRGETGELLVRGAHVALGYWHGPGIVEAFEDGWYRSGDMMRQTGSGDFQFTGRRKDLIVRAGSNISPLEVEQVLSAHPDVEEAAVIGVPDAILGQRVIGFVRLRPDAAENSLDLILSAARPLLADYKLPERLLRLDQMPRTPLGKIDRIALGAILAT
jgi:long-chain acyl-CoA synthetase